MRSLEEINEEYRSQCVTLGDLHVKRDAIDAAILQIKQKVSALQIEGKEVVKLAEELKKVQETAVSQPSVKSAE